MKGTVVLLLLGAIVACTQLVGCAAVPTFPNIGFLGQGYDIYFGSPRTVITQDSPDPGYRGAVWNLTIWGGTTPDERYRIPKGTTVNKCDSCRVSFDTQNITGAQSYQSVLDVAVSVSASGWGARFSASTDYKTVNKNTRSQTSVYTQSEAQCCVYRAELQVFTSPPLTDDFTAGVARLPTVYNSTTSPIFSKFIGAFGTHYTNLVTMGGRFGQRSRLSSTSWSKLTSSDLTVTVSAGYSALSFSAAAKVMTNVEKQQAQTYSSLSQDQQIFNVGGALPASYQLADWINSSQADPMPINVRLSAIADVLDSDNFPNDKQIVDKQKALAAAYLDYCNTLLKAGYVDTCQPPPPSPPVPPRSIFGGIYQEDDCHQKDLANPYTGSLNCKSGYSPQLAAHYYTDRTCIARQYVCLLDGMTRDPLQSFGGMYQPGEDKDQLKVKNYLTGDFSCPSGYVSMNIGDSIIQVDREPRVWYQPTYACFNVSSQAVDSATNLGGFQKWDYNPNHPAIPSVPNYWTKALSCQDGYKPYQVGQGWSWWSNHGMQYWCINNVFTR